MIRSLCLLLLLMIMIVTMGCTLNTPAAAVHSLADSLSQRVQLVTLTDYSRNRNIPVALYLPDSQALKQTLVVFSHGYGELQPDSYLGYAYLNEFLAGKGYLVASIQHELPDDEPLPMEGNLREARMPNWENGVRNILFVTQELKSRMPNLNDKRIVVIGHSNGGDMSMLFATEYPRKTSKAISLDNRRMPLPLIDSLKIYSLRSSDLPADQGVLPSAEACKAHGITVIDLPKTRHVEMTDALASPEQKEEICRYVLLFLEQK